MLHFTILSTLPKSLPKNKTVTKGSCKKIFCDNLLLSLRARLLGMNVGGLPATQDPNGFIIVISLMTVIGTVELWYFKRKGWLD
jgi:hypothetical protein